MQDKWKTVVDEAKAFQHYILCQACQDFCVCAVQCRCAELLAVNTEAKNIGKVYVSMGLVLLLFFLFFLCLSHTVSFSLCPSHPMYNEQYMWVNVFVCISFELFHVYIVEIVIIVCVCWLHSENSNLNKQSTLLSFYSVESYKLDGSIGFYLPIFCTVH